MRVGLIYGIRTFIKQAPGPLPVCEDTVRSLQSGPKRGLFTEPEHAGTLVLTFSLQNCEEKISAVYKPPSLWQFVIAARRDEDTSLSLYHLKYDFAQRKSLTNVT